MTSTPATSDRSRWIALVVLCVGALREADAAVGLEQPAGGERGRDADRDVDEEDPVPVERLGQHATGKQPD